ncbi:MAG TPA: hypothetical protein VFX76_01650, partial [Roseiflexaceae bacterium]|nr:hypothetical protein [Roseiflexaceae bacterium]
LRAYAKLTDIVPCYDHSARRLFLVDAQPGGNGLAAWIYSHAEQLLPLAYDVALACRNDALLEPLSRADMDWLLALLGRVPEAVPAERARVPAPARAKPVELIEGPPPAAPRIVLTPAPPDERRTTNDVPGIRNPKPDTQNPKPETPHPAPDRRPANDVANTRNPKRDTQNPKPDARQRELPFGGEQRSERPASRQSPPPPPTPPSQRPGKSAPPPDDAPPDADALLARLRRQRAQREAQQGTQRRAPQSRNEEPAEVEQRFAAGDRIFCLPYGDGEVKESRVEDGREILTVNFANHGDLQINPAVNFVRKVEQAPEEDDLL